MIRLIFLSLFFISVSSKSYHTTDVLLTRIKMKCAIVPELSCTMHDDILVVDYNKDLQDTRDLLVVFNEHARERVTGELALHFIHRLQRWKPKKRITMVPVLNVFGRKEVENGHPCKRKNQNNVDTNRNYQMQNINQHRYKKGSEEYEGPYPLSEKESRLVSSLLLEGTQRYINVHSGEKSIYMPYDSRVSKRPQNYDTMNKNIHKWAKKCRECNVGPAATTSFYKAYGTSVDWAVDHGIPEAYTFEIYGKVDYDCNKMFNPSRRDLITVLNQWSGILKDVLSSP